MKRLIFFDIDGTLLDHDKQIPDSTRQAVQELKEAGHEVAIATGRGPFMFKDIRESLDIHSYISYNGQYVVRNDEVIYRNPLNTKLIKQISLDALSRNHPIVYMDQETMKTNTEYHEYVEESIATLKIPQPGFDPEYYVNRPLYQCLLFSPAADDDYYKETYKEVTFIRWHPFSSDIIPLGGSKARGIEEYMKVAGVGMDQVYAFGDGLNDIEMLEFVENSVAMGNAIDLVKESAKHVTSNVEDDGILQGLRKLGLL